jgi:hypothetical protein
MKKKHSVNPTIATGKKKNIWPPGLLTTVRKMIDEGASYKDLMAFTGKSKEAIKTKCNISQVSLAGIKDE